MHAYAVMEGEHMTDGTGVRALPLMLMEVGSQSTLAPISSMASAKATSPCTLDDPHPSTVIFELVRVAPATTDSEDLANGSSSCCKHWAN